MDKYLHKIKSFYKTNKRMPSYSEISTLLGFKSKNASFQLIKKLIDGEYVDKDSTGKLIPGKLFNSLKILGTIAAGFPSPAEEELVDTMTLDEFLIDNKEATYMLTVQGDSMIDAGIMPGDLVLVERTNTVKENDIVIAEVDGEWTMKYLRFSGKQPILVAANKKYKPIKAQDELKISAIVKAVIRKYKI